MIQKTNMKININWKARVTLTARGAQVLNDHNRQFHISGDYQKDERAFPTNYVVGDVYETELWDAMHIWGPQIIMGAPTVFDKNEIEIKEN